MKKLSRTLVSSAAALAALTCLSISSVKAAEDDDHEHHHHHATMAGPNGGKVLHEVEPHAELLVTKNRKLQITFLNEDGKADAPGKQSISVICGKRSQPTRMKFALKGKSFLSDKALPAGLNIPTVVQIKMGPKEKATIIRLNLNLENCRTCKHLEYACTCEHAHEEHDKKDLKRPK
jgi:ABC-type nickel/cobalt efflux system permease component RcnA